MPQEYKNPPLFGANVDPGYADPREPFRRAQLADQNGLELITVQDHPYNRRLFDTWTLLSALAMKTEHVHLGTNVISTPLRPPTMLAKQAATLDVLSDGRLELGLGAGAYWPGINAFGVEKRSPGESVDAFEEALQIIRGLFASQGEAFNFDGDYYRARGLKLGPMPAHPIRLWTGAYGERMLDLTGRLADGVFVSSTYLPPKGWARHNRLIDAGAESAGRSPDEIRRGYNLMGVLDLGREDTKLAEQKEGHVFGPVRRWVDRLVEFYHEQRIDTFIFWPVSGNEPLQIEAFAKEVAPAVREALVG